MAPNVRLLKYKLLIQDFKRTKIKSVKIKSSNPVFGNLMQSTLAIKQNIWIVLFQLQSEYLRVLDI